jgi:RHS repeat-associated protein
LQDYPFDAAPMPAPTDPLAMRNYTQNYSYDAVGNMLELQHVAGTGSYTRSFVYNNYPAHPGANNQLLSTTVGANPTVNYSYDGHGNMLNLPPLPALAWNYKDQLVAATQQAVSSGTGQTTYYTYDGDGMRTRKVTVGAAAEGGTPTLLSERLYIGNYEIYRAYDGSGNVTLQRETLHVMDDKSRIATIDNKTIDTQGSDSTTLNTYYPRYQYGNLVGSVAYELDGSGNIVSYEEYHPFGTTSYQAASAALDVPLRRYRYTGKERDDESGLYYHGARYYVCWLCRWISPDALGTIDGANRYSYVNNNPVSVSDPTGHGGEETNEVTPYLREVLNKYGIKFSEQVQFKVTNEAGKVITGFFDMVIVDPRTGKPFHLELKGLDKDAFSTPGQEEYVKIFESKEGKMITYTGKNGGALGLKTGDTFFVNQEAFQRVARGDMAGFAEEMVKAVGGKKILHTFYSDKEGWKTFTSDEEFHAFLKDRGLGHLVPETKPGGKGGGGNEGNEGGGGSEKNATKEVETTGKDVEKQVEKDAEKGSEKVAEKVAEKTAERSVARTLGEHAPIVGFAFTVRFVREDLDRGEYFEAFLDALGPVPIAGEVAGGYQLTRDSVNTATEVMTEELSIWDRGINQLYGVFGY